jgi:hypothetical protein
MEGVEWWRIVVLGANFKAAGSASFDGSVSDISCLHFAFFPPS